jgi:hypothetical protein
MATDQTEATILYDPFVVSVTDETNLVNLTIDYESYHVNKVNEEIFDQDKVNWDKTRKKNIDEYYRKMREEEYFSEDGDFMTQTPPYLMKILTDVVMKKVINPIVEEAVSYHLEYELTYQSNEEVFERGRQIDNELFKKLLDKESFEKSISTLKKSIPGIIKNLITPLVFNLRSRSEKSVKSMNV